MILEIHLFLDVDGKLILQWINNTLFAEAVQGGSYSGCNATRVHQWLVLGNGWETCWKAIEGTIRRATHDQYNRNDSQYVRNEGTD